MHALRGTLAAAVLVAAALASAAGAAHAPAPQPVADAVDVPGSPLDVTRVTFGQQADHMVLDVRTVAAWTPGLLSAAAGRSVCVKLFRRRVPTPSAHICVVEAHGAVRLRFARLHADASAYAVHLIKATISRRDRRSLQASFAPAAAGLPVGRYAWQAETAWTDAAACATPGRCNDRTPDNGVVSARIARRPAATPKGCVPHGPTERRSGARGPRTVALTFDDGPSAFTPKILRELEHEHVPATFFLVGNQVPGHGALLHRMLRDGFMLGDHTLTHANVAGGGSLATHQIAATQKIIRRASGFEPCLFRPPYGATSGALSSVVHSLGALSILWDVDPQDWRTPGTGAIVSTVMSQARSGSIILLHDGGGPRGQTVAALPTIIRGLRRRGLRFVTVTQLLHLRLR